MNDQSELGELPRFSRDIATIFGPDQLRHGDSAPYHHFVLRPFTGMLDVSPQPGRVPMIDLSYLSLQSLITSTLERSRGRLRDRSPTDPGDVDRSETSETRRPEGTGGERGDDPGNRTVREALLGKTAEKGHPRGADRQHSSSISGDPPERGSDLHSWTLGQRTSAKKIGSFDSRLQKTHLEGSPSPGDGDPGSPFPKSQQATSEASRRRFESPLTYTEPGETTPTASESTPTMVSRDRTFQNQAESSIATGQPYADPTVSSPDTIDESDDISPPRMTTQVRDRMGPHPPTDGHSGGPDRSSNAADNPGSGPALGRSDGTADRPSDPTHRSPDQSTTETGPARTSAPDPARDQSEIPEHRSVFEASNDPESRLVDRLYRALREREAIERRRRGGR